MLKSIPCTLMRGGTSKGLYFNEADLPADRELRDGAASRQGLARCATDRWRRWRPSADQ